MASTLRMHLPLRALFLHAPPFIFKILNKKMRSQVRHFLTFYPSQARYWPQAPWVLADLNVRAGRNRPFWLRACAAAAWLIAKVRVITWPPVAATFHRCGYELCSDRPWAFGFSRHVVLWLQSLSTSSAAAAFLNQLPYTPALRISSALTTRHAGTCRPRGRYANA